MKTKLFTLLFALMASTMMANALQTYTVSEAIAAFDAGTLKTGDSCQVIGTISRWCPKSDLFDTYQSVSYYVTDGAKEFEFYCSYSLDKARFAIYDYYSNISAMCQDVNEQHLFLEDTVIGAGKIKKYGDIYEFDMNCYLKEIRHPKEGTCGANLTWKLTSGILTISGAGDMNNFSYAPWYSYRSSIKTVIIGDSVTSIGTKAFCGCSSLTSIEIPTSVTNIGENAFKSCTSLISITIPNSVTSIGDWAFASCSGLTSVTIPNSVTSIGERTFYYCTGLTSVTIPNSVTSIGEYAFDTCTGLISVEIPNSVTSIGGAAFLGCTSLTTVEISNSVTSIESSTFSYCSDLTSITIPNSVTSIGGSAFVQCLSLTSITISNSVTSIGTQAFDGCSGLTSIEIPNSVTNIGNEAFEDCTSLISVIIGNSVTSIGELAFYRCSSLTSVTCYATNPPELAGWAFAGVDCAHIPLYVPAESITAYQTADQWKDFASILPIEATETETNDVIITPSDNSIEVEWPAISDAATYELIIKDKQGNIICTLVFNANGQLTSITFHAPARGNAPQQTQGTGFAFTINSLDSGTNYDLIFVAKDSNDVTLLSKTVSFTTKGDTPTGINQITNDKWEMTNKILRNGQLFILRGNKTYTLTGAEVR